MVWPRKNIFAEYTQPVPPRFYVPEARADDSTIELPEDEAAHLTRVLRLSRGDRIRVFNGRGDEWDARVDDTRKHRAWARLDTRIIPTPEPRVSITLALAVLKGDKMDDIVRDAVMLGVSTIAPMITARTELSAAALERSNRIARWQRIAVSSAKQCGRAVVPEISQAADFRELIARAENAVMLVEPATGAGTASLRDLAPTERRVPASGGANRLTLFIGPEGGWTPEEVQRGRDGGAMLLTLGGQTLRADAVPVVGLTALRVRLEDF
jgi:16S rRNA (uracil1498-N3)-methyltransferase